MESLARSQGYNGAECKEYTPLLADFQGGVTLRYIALQIEQCSRVFGVVRCVQAERKSLYGVFGVDMLVATRID